MHFSNSKLAAYVRDELDVDDVDAVETVMAIDPQIARRAVVALLDERLGSRVRPIFPSSHAEPAIAIAGPRRRATEAAISASRGRNFLQFALAVFAVLLAGSAYLAGYSSRPVAGALVMGELGSGGLQTALGGVPTGAESETSAGVFRAVSSFKSADGTLCREFTLAQSSGNRHAVACRQPQGWSVDFALVEPRTGDQYQPADGNDLIGAYLQRLGAGGPLTAKAEREALGGPP